MEPSKFRWKNMFEKNGDSCGAYDSNSHIKF